VGAAGRPVYARVSDTPDQAPGPFGTAQPAPDPSSPAAVVVVGAASRDLASDDSRGWRLGGAVTYASLAMARLGLRVIALLGADPVAAAAHELDLLREAGVDLHVIRLKHGPVFENIETPRARIQRALDAADPLPPTAADRQGRDANAARGWFLAPVGGELGDAWSSVVPGRAQVAAGWQGLLRTFMPDGTVVRRTPEPSALLRRADLVGVSRDDLSPDVSIDSLTALLAPRATLAITHGAEGGLLVEPIQGGGRPMRRYPAIASARTVDVTGAGDTFLAALFAARLEPRLLGGRLDHGLDVLLAAAMASLVVEDRGLAGVPTRSAVRDRMREGLAQRGRRD
jgi:sugar/nucleoside kinase (ribokinase family)